MEVTSRLHITVKLNIEHEGEVQDGITQELLGTTLKEAAEGFLKEDDDALEMKVSCYIQHFEYKDNIETLRARVRARLETLDQEALKELETQLKEMQ